MAKRYDINDTAIAPYVMADGVVEKVARCYGAKYGTRADANRLGKRAETLYSKSKSFRKKMQRRDPRGLLEAFMLHWHAAQLQKRSPKIAREVGDAAWYGHGLSCPRRK